MLEHFSWVLCDFCENLYDEFVNIEYQEKEIDIFVSHNKENCLSKIIKYNYEDFIKKLFESLKISDVVYQAKIDVQRSVTIINDEIIDPNKSYHKLVKNLKKNNFNIKDSLKLLMLVTQASYGIIYEYICKLYPDNYIGEISCKDSIKDNKIQNSIIIENNVLKLDSKKKLRIFDVIDGNDVTLKKIQINYIVDLIKKNIYFMVYEIDEN